MGRQFETSRAVEVISPNRGTAYRIGGRLVLTAAHILDDVGSDCEVNNEEGFGIEKAKVVWKAQGLDIALIELPEKIEVVEAITFGKLPKATAGEKLTFQMYAYPAWAETQRKQGCAAVGGRHIEGTIYLSDRSPDKLLVLEAERLPPEVEVAYDESEWEEESDESEGEGASGKSEWRGASGAAIFCDGLLIAVQKQHQNPGRPASLEASPLWMVYEDKQWRQLIKKHGINSEPEIARIQAGSPMTETILLSALLLLKKTSVDVSNSDRETRKEQARLLKAVAAAVRKLVDATTAFYDALQKKNSPGGIERGYWQLEEACYELEAYFTRSLPGNKAIELLQEWCYAIRLSPAAMVSMYDKLNSDGTIREELFKNWRGHYTSAQAADSYRSEYLGLSNVYREVLAIRKELTKIASQIKVTAVLLENDALGKPSIGG